MTLTPSQAVVAVLFLLLVVIAIGMALRRRRSARLKSRFGREYDRVVHETGSEGDAEATLAQRRQRVSGYPIKPLSSEMRDHFIATWRTVQAQFADDPRTAVSRADDLLGEVMQVCGYPLHDFARRAEDLSGDHPDVVQHYRTAHDIASSQTRGSASTEQLRMAMIHFRALFDDLVNEPEPYAWQPVAPGSRQPI